VHSSQTTRSCHLHFISCLGLSGLSGLLTMHHFFCFLKGKLYFYVWLLKLCCTKITSFYILLLLLYFCATLTAISAHYFHFEISFQYGKNKHNIANFTFCKLQFISLVAFSPTYSHLLIPRYLRNFTIKLFFFPLLYLQKMCSFPLRCI